MEYRNVKTGVIVNVTSELAGDWVKVEEEPKKDEKAETKTPKKKTTKK